MKQFFCIMLVSALTLPFTGCAASASNDHQSVTPPQPVKDTIDEQDETVSAKIAENYRISIASEEQHVYELSELIDMLPVQPRPATATLQKDFCNYLSALKQILERITVYDEQAQDDFSKGHLTEEDYDSIDFQLDQLSGRIQGLEDALYIIYGLNENAIDPAA